MIDRWWFPLLVFAGLVIAAALIVAALAGADRPNGQRGGADGGPPCVVCW